MGKALSLRLAAQCRVLEPRPPRGALSPLFGDVGPLQAGLERFAGAYTRAEHDANARKLGFAEWREEDDTALVRDLHALLHAHEIDMTLWFRALAELDPAAPSLSPFEGAFYDPAKRGRARARCANGWRVTPRVAEDLSPGDERRERMRLANPKFVLRNWLAQQAIDRAHEGDFAGIGELLEVMRRPYDEQPGQNASPASARTGRRTRPAARCCPVLRSGQAKRIRGNAQSGRGPRPCPGYGSRARGKAGLLAGLLSFFAARFSFSVFFRLLLVFLLLVQALAHGVLLG